MKINYLMPSLKPENAFINFSSNNARATDAGADSHINNNAETLSGSDRCLAKPHDCRIVFNIYWRAKIAFKFLLQGFFHPARNIWRIDQNRSRAIKSTGNTARNRTNFFSAGKFSGIFPYASSSLPLYLLLPDWA